MRNGGNSERSKSPLGTTYEIACAHEREHAFERELERIAKDSENSSQIHLRGIEETEVKSVLRRLERYRIQAVARSILPDERVGKCHRLVIPQQHFVKIWQAHERAHYSGLVTCGSVWNCPVCAGKISERRRVDLAEALRVWIAQGGLVLAKELTVPHYSFQPLREVLTGFAAARRLLRMRNSWRKDGFARDIGLKGSVRALEVTYGVNGYHVHSHELLFVTTDCSQALGCLEQRLLKMWQSACVSAGMGKPDHHGAKIHDGTYAAKYVGKWGLEHELSKAHVKHGRNGNLTPWDMLRGIDEGVSELVPRFREYAREFKGRHQLEWSKGMRDLLGLGRDKTDGELAAEIEEDAVLLGMLDREQWRTVLRADRRGEVLEIAAREGWDGVVKFIRRLVMDGFGSAPF